MENIRLSKSAISDKEKQAVMSVLDKEYLGMGSEVNQFEQELTAYFGREAICVSTGTAALQLAIECAGIGIGDEVLVPTLTYVASFQAISATGAKPIACDIENLHLSINLRDAEARLTKNTKAIMLVHYSGAVGDFDAVIAFAKKHNLRLIEDAAHAFGSQYKGKKIGSIGDITCFSFDGIKNITSGEGGCIVSNDARLNSRIKDARLLGVEKDTQARFSGERSWDFDVSYQGWRYHMSNIMAAIGRVQLSRFEELTSKRQRLACRYVDMLTKCNGVKPIVNDFSLTVPHIFVVRLPAYVDRDLLRSELKEMGIETGVHYQPNHILSFYKNANQGPFPVLDSVFSSLLTLPMHPDLEFSDIDRVVDSLQKVISKLELI